MRLIYNDALNKRIAPYLERLTKKRTSLDKETMTLLDVFMQYFNMDTRYGTYSDKLEPCIIHIIQEEKIKSVANLFDGKLNKVLRYLLGDEYVNPEKPDVPLNKNDAFQKVQKRHVQEKR